MSTSTSEAFLPALMREEGFDVPVHPVAALLPLIEGDDFTNLVEDIRANGQQVPCVMLGEVLVDGRNRWRACRKLGIEPKREQYSGRPNHVGDYILSLNVARRNLTDGQIAVITAKACKYLDEEAAVRRNGTQFKPGASPNPGGKPKAEVTQKAGTPEKRDHAEKHERSTAGRVASLANVSRYKAEQAIAVVKKSPDLADQVASGKMKLSEAAERVAPKAATRAPSRSIARDRAAEALALLQSIPITDPYHAAALVVVAEWLQERVEKTKALAPMGATTTTESQVP